MDAFVQPSPADASLPEPPGEASQCSKPLPPTPTPSLPEVRFGSFTLIPAARLLLDDGRPCPLGARAFDVLVALVERRSRVVPKAELLDVAWRGLVVEDNNLSIQISTLRRQLGPLAIATVSGRGYRFTLPCEGDAGNGAPVDLSERAHGSRPRIAVLPFTCPAAAHEHYFGDGITEEIIAQLARNRLFFVIARGSTLRYRERTRSTAEIASELGVRYVLDGSVRRCGGRLRISAELSDCQRQRVLWTDRFDGAEDELFEMQARIALKIAAAIDPCVREAELEQYPSRPTHSLDAYDSVLRGLHLQFIEGGDGFQEAGACFERAVQLDPRYAQAHAYLAWWFTMCIGEGRTSMSAEHRRLAIRHACRAVEIDPRDAWALAIAGHTHSFLQKQFAVALDMFEQALAINPSCAVAWSRCATTLAYLGRGKEAVQRVQNALALSPFDPFAFSFCTTHGLASMACDEPDDAVWWLEKARRLNPRYRACERLLIAAHSQCGHLDVARRMASDFLRSEPDFRVGAFGSWYPLQEPHKARLLEALIGAGLPA